MLTFDEAITQIIENMVCMGTMNVPLKEACSFVLAEDIHADRDMPAFDKSIRDGYALRSVDTADGNTEFRVIGESKAGLPFTGVVRSGEAVSIMTGAMMPKGADAVVMIEDVSNSVIPAKAGIQNSSKILDPRLRGDDNRSCGDDIVKIVRPYDTGAFISKRGSDIREGSLVLKKGEKLGPARIAVLATFGRKEVTVFKKPRVAVIITGDEVVPFAEDPKAHELRDANGPLLRSLLEEDGFEVSAVDIVKDDEKLMKTALSSALENDAVIVSGGVSAGKYDLVPMVLEGLGVKKVFHKVMIKPGKPLFFGLCGDKPVFGAPGNPVSVFASYKLFIRMALRIMSGETNVSIKKMNGRLLSPIVEKEKRLSFVPVCAQYNDGGYFLEPVTFAGSADIFSVAHANAFAIVPPETDILEKGSQVEFFIW